MNIIFILVLLGLAIILRVKQNLALAVSCGGLALILIIVRLASPLWSASPAERNIEKANQVLIDGMARQIAERYPKGNVIILGTVGSAESTGQAKEYYDTEVKLTKALKKNGMTVESMAALPNQPNSDLDEEIERALDAAGPEDDPLLDMMLALEAASEGGGPLDGLRELKGRADVVIYNKFLPGSVDPWKLPEAGSGPSLVLINHPGWDDLPDLLESTVLDMVLAFRPDISRLMTRKWPRDDKVAFDQRYQLLTPENPSLSK